MPVKGGGGIGGPRKKPKPKSGVGAAIKQAGSRPAPKRPTPKPGARMVGKAVQKAGRPVAATTRRSGDAPQTRKQDTRKAAAYTRSKAGKRSRVVARRAEEKRQVRKALSLVEGASRRRVKQSGPNALQQAVRIPEKVPGALDRELRGKGVVLPAIGKAAKKVAEIANSNPYGSDVERSGVGIQSQMREGPKRLSEDALNLAPSAVSGAYVYGRAGAKALTGDTKEAKAVIKGIQQDDPVYALATGDPKRALKLANEHPGFAAAEVFGVARGLDRGASRTVRGTGRTLKGVGKATGSKRLQEKGEKVRRVAATETRPDAVVPGTNLRESRRYDRGLVTKTVQKRQDKKKARQAQDLRQRADNLERTHGGPTQASTQLRRDAAQKDPTVMKPGKVKRAVDVYEAASESNRKRKMADADDKIAEVTKGERGAAMNLVAQRIVDATPDDLRAYKAELERAYKTLDSASKRAANENLRSLIDESLKAEKKKPGTLKKSEAAAKRYAREVDQPLDRRLEDLGLIDKAQAARSKLEPYAVRRMGAKVDPKQGLVTKGGAKLSDDAIRAHMKRNGVDPDDAAYISQAPNSTSAGSYYRSSYQEPKYTGKARTEKPTQEGTFDASTEAVRARATKAANVIAAAENYRGFLKDFAVRDPDSGRSEVVSLKAAKEGAARLTERTGVDYRVVRATPWGVSKDQFARMLDDIGDEADPRAFKAFREQIDAGLKGEGEGPYAIIPETAARQLQEHMDVLSPNDAGKLAQAARASFSRTVLSLSPSPTAGNLVEGAFRALASRSGPTSRVTYGRVMKRLREIDPEAAARFEDRTLGTGRVSLQTQRRFTEPQQFSDGPMRKAVAGVAAARKLPGPKQASAAWQAWTSLVFDRINNTMIERPAQKVMLGKAIRDSGLMNDGALNTSRKAIEQAAQGLRGTAEQVRMADDLRDMYGAYRAFSPTKRRVIANYTPFLAWYLNAARFVGVVLPRDHPVALAVIASAAQVTDDVDRQKARPGWLKGTLESGGVTWQATRNTPFGAFTDPLATGEGLILPQISVLSAVAQGEDWKGKKLRNPDGSPYTEQQKIAYALGELMKSSVPAVAVPDRVTKYANKPSSLLNAVRVNVPKGRDSDGSPQVKATKRKKSKTPADPLARLDDLMSQQVDDDLERRLAELDEVVK